MPRRERKGVSLSQARSAMSHLLHLVPAGLIFKVHLDSHSSLSAYIHGVNPLSYDATPFDIFRFGLVIFGGAFLHLWS